MRKYISKGEWFDAGTECELVVDCTMGGVPMGIFSGLRNGLPDEELCGLDEFDVIEVEEAQ